jgi:cytosol alanyl aminopeptidase
MGEATALIEFPANSVSENYLLETRIMSLIARLCSFLSTLLSAALAFAANPHDEATPLGRLPADIRPLSYAIELDVDPSKLDFSGKVAIDVELSQTRQVIWLHGKDLRPSMVQISTSDGDLIGKYAQVDDSGVVKLSFPAPIAPGKARINIHYHASYSTRLDGLYKISDGGKPYLFTQFESVFARQMFPSFDEPGFKTPFDMTLRIPKDLRAIFNTPELSALNDGDKTVIRYLRTQKLPTYLLAVVVGDIDIVDYADIGPSVIRDRSIPLRGVATKGKGQFMNYALANTAAIVERLEAYFDHPYPYEKLDLIAVPDFASGAMENAGAITYREQLLLIKDDAPISQKVRYTGTHAHELAHQWFGNLVTPVWWDDIWLNEAFATWMGIKIAGGVQPSLNFQNRVQQGALDAMDLDSFTSARKIRNEVNDKNEIIGAFDSITYRKGGGVLAMFEAYLGEEKFREGVRLHIKRHADGNASAKDFLEALRDAAKDPTVRPAFESFLVQNGVPLLSVSYQCKDKTATLALTQQRFVNVGVATNEQSWQVPFCARFQVGDLSKKQCTILQGPTASMAIDSKRCPAWVMPNAEGAGYFRLQLDAQSWKHLIRARKQLQASELLSLQDALAAGVYAGEISLDSYLTQSAALLDTKQNNLWTNTANNARNLFELLPKSFTPKKAQRLFIKLWPTLGIDATTAMDDAQPAATADARSRVLEFVAMQARDPKLRKLLKARGDRYLGIGTAADSKAVQPDLRQLALAVAAQESKLASQKLEALVLSSNDAVLRAQGLIALGFVDDERAAGLRELALNSSLRGNEMMLILQTQSNQRATRDENWAWAQTNLSRILARLSDKSVIQVFELAANQCQSGSAKEVESFFRPKLAELSNGPRGLANALEKIHRCSAMQAR